VNRLPGVGVLATAILMSIGCVTSPPPSLPASSDQSLVPPAPSAIGSDGTAAGWKLVATGDRTAATQVRGVAVADRGFIAVGSSGQAGEIAMAWSSPDGATWTPEDMPSRGTSPNWVVSWDGRFLAFGGGSSPRCAHPGEIDTWVRQPDGTWLEAPFDPKFCVGGSLTPIIQGSRAWLIGNGFGEVPTAFDSQDGLTWTNRSKPLGDVQVMASAVDETGLWVSDRSGATGEAEVRWSADGRVWAKADLPAIGITDAPSLITLGNRIGVVAPTGQGFAILTRQGEAWRSVPISGLGGFGLLIVRPAGAGLVAIASRQDGGFALLTSTDGASWRSVPLPAETGPEPLVWDVAVGHGLVVLVGQVPPPSTDEVAGGGIWTAPESILAP
jgi:hypothetical protein